jgi:hypothetical protein
MLGGPTHELRRTGGPIRLASTTSTAESEVNERDVTSPSFDQALSIRVTRAAERSAVQQQRSVRKAWSGR